MAPGELTYTCTPGGAPGAARGAAPQALAAAVAALAATAATAPLPLRLADVQPRGERAFMAWLTVASAGAGASSCRALD